MLAAQGGDAPVLLRIADPYAMAVVVGVMAPPRDVSRLAASVLTLEIEYNIQDIHSGC